MASRCRSLTSPTMSLIKSTLTKPSIKPRPAPSFTVRSSPTISRLVPRLGSLESLLPLHSAVSSARLTSCLGIDSMSSKSLSQAAPVLRRFYFIPNPTYTQIGSLCAAIRDGILRECPD